MNNRVLTAAFLIVLLGGMSVGAYKLYLMWAESNGKVAASEAKVENTLRICGDSYLGYFFIDSTEMKLQSARRGLGVQFVKDNGNYGERLQKFAAGQCDAVVMPINSYLEHGRRHQYPGVFTGAIAESKGADAIACFADKLPTGKVEDLNNANLQIVYGKESPSEFLMNLTMVDFDLFNLQKVNTWRQEEVDGSAAVLKRARTHQGDCFVMWEPDVSKALREVPELKRVWGSEEFSGYITDVFIFRRDVVSNQAEHVITFLEAYFSTMRAYGNDRDRMIAEMKQSNGLSKDEVENILKQIDWHDLYENASKDLGFSVSVGAPANEGLAASIARITKVLAQTGKLISNPKIDPKSDPVNDPYSIINTESMKAVIGKMANAEAGVKVEHKFAELSPADWDKLDKLGTMKVEPITFQRGTSDLDSAGTDQVDKIAELLVSNYPDHRVLVKGHTAPGSDEQANVELSQARAETVVQRLIAVHAQQAERFRAVGMGSSEPPPKRAGQNQRDYTYKLPRVEFVLYKDKESL